jgi:hypothetical protein
MLLHGCFHRYTSAESYPIIEIFDISKEEVVKEVPSNTALQNEVRKYLTQITDLYVKFNPIPSKGYLIKIPLVSPVKVKNQWLDDFVTQVIVVIPTEEKPYLMVFYGESKYLFLTFEGKLDTLFRFLEFNP